MSIQEIFAKYKQEKEFIEISIPKMKEDLGELVDKIVLYGAGSAGIAFFHYLQDIGINPLYFTDGNEKKWNTTCEGIAVIDYHEITERVGRNALVIVCINTDGVKYCKSFDEALRVGGHQGVHKNLREAGCENVIDYTYFRRCRELFRGEKYNLPSCSDVRLMEQHEDEIKQVYSMLADEKSQEVFEKIVYFRMLDDSIIIPTEPQEKQYFEYEFYPRRNDEVFVDCGAYNGISLNTFLKENENSFSYYYGIEPDIRNFEKLRQFVEKLPKEIQQKIQLVNKAAYYETDKKVGLYELSGPGSFLSENGNAATLGVKIDDLVEAKGVSFIKMNIEGSEVNALIGAEKTITNFQPRLAIAGYHRTEDLWKIPLMICKFNAEYKIYLRSYMNHLSFVYYAN